MMNSKVDCEHKSILGRRVTECGAVIDSGKRNITAWRMTDETGNVIEEKTFS